MMTSKSTIVVVDTHKPEMVLDENILNKANRKVVIDHHRRGESFISNPLLVYMEPYASSTAELVTELLEYQPTEQRLTRLESTVMYAGIIVDTRNFTLRTGSRTFDAASYLRAHGADTILTQHFLKMTSIRISIVQNLFEQLKFKIMALQLHMVLTKKFIILLQLHKRRMSC